MRVKPTFHLFRAPNLSFPFNINRPISSLSTTKPSQPPPKSLKSPQTPLFLKPSTHSTTISDLKKWNDWAKTLASSVGSSFAESDNGPDTSLLYRELKWLIEDSTEDHETIHNSGNQTDTQKLKLRVSLDELYGLWKQRIEERRPFQYLVGCEHWRDLVLSVEEGVLIPRPETEVVVDLVADLVEKDEGLRNGLWADLGTGSGAIAIGIGRFLGKNGRVIATDLSNVAVSVASFNVQRYGLQDVIEVRHGSWVDPLKEFEGKLSGFVSNPPYIPSDDISGLQAEVGRHEPRLALDGGENGMDSLLQLCDDAALMLKPGGFFTFETNGEKQCKYLVDYLLNSTPGCFFDVNIVSDFAGIQRFVTGFRR